MLHEVTLPVDTVLSIVSFLTFIYFPHPHSCFIPFLDGSKKMAPLPTQVSVLACSGLYNRKVETDGGGTGTAEYPAV